MSYAVRIAKIFDCPDHSIPAIRWLRLSGIILRRVEEFEKASRYDDLESARRAARHLGVDPYMSIDILEIEKGRLYDRIDI